MHKLLAEGWAWTGGGGRGCTTGVVVGQVRRQDSYGLRLCGMLAAAQSRMHEGEAEDEVEDGGEIERMGDVVTLVE